MSSLYAKTNSIRLINFRLLVALATMLAPACLSFTAKGQQTPGQEIAFPLTIQWDKQRGVARYRLQVAGDQEFQNVFFDRPVIGEQYVVSGISAGYYYWRVAAVDSRGFSQPVRVFISGGVVTPVDLARLPSRGIGARLSPVIINSKSR